MSHHCHVNVRIHKEGLGNFQLALELSLWEWKYIPYKAAVVWRVTSFSTSIPCSIFLPPYQMSISLFSWCWCFYDTDARDRIKMLGVLGLFLRGGALSCNHEISELWAEWCFEE